MGPSLEQQLGDAVRAFRRDKSITQERLSEESGLHVTYIAGIETGRRNPSLRSIVAIANGLGIEPSALLARMESKVPNSFPCHECQSQISRPNRICEHQHRAVKTFVQPRVTRETTSAINQIVDGIMVRIDEVFGTPAYLDSVAHGASSGVFQALMMPIFERFGFVSEVGYAVVDAAFKPDFTLNTPEFSVMVEVERGKTLDNNMDMLDMWKCHIHPTIRQLILMVPIWYEKTGTNPSASASFSRVCRRMAPFFEPGNETNVHSLHVVGY